MQRWNFSRLKCFGKWRPSLQMELIMTILIYFLKNGGNINRNTVSDHGFSSDDSIQDPNFELSDMDISSSFAHEELLQMGIQFEKNLIDSPPHTTVENQSEYDSSKIIIIIIGSTTGSVLASFNINIFLHLYRSLAYLIQMRTPRLRASWSTPSLQC